MKKITLTLLLITLFPLMGACTHKKVNVTQFDDKDKSCAELKREITTMEELEKDIDEKTGMSGRNVGMALLFWPGIIVNEMNAGDARDRASERKEKLFDLYDQKSCS